MNTTDQCSTRVRDVERAVRRVRWGAIVFSIVMPLLYEPTAEGVRPTVDLFLAGALMTIALCVAQLLSLRTERLDIDRARRIGWVILAIDALVTTSVPIVYAFDHFSDFWPLLTFVILEGAMRGGMRTALGVWAFGAGAHALNSWRLLDTRPNPDSWIASIPWAAGILLMVAVGAGALGSRVMASDAAVDGWRERLLRLTARTDRLALLDEADDIWAAAAEMAAEIAGAAEAHATALPGHEQSSEVTTGFRIPVRQDGVDVGHLWIDTAPEDVDDDDVVLLELLARHVAGALQVVATTQVARNRAAELHASAIARGQFLGELSHELRTPLTVIVGSAELLDRWDELSPERRAHVRQMLADNVARLGRLVIDATEAMTSDVTELAVKPGPRDIAGLVHEVVRTHDHHEHHRFQVDLPDELPLVHTDPDRFVQILHNLVGNAVNYSPDGGTVRVDVSVEVPAVEVTVTDEGVGIPADRLERLFGRMARLHPELGVKGSGLGLHLSRQLARAMGGDIQVRTEPGVGSSFTVSLPLVGVLAPDTARRPPGVSTNVA